MKKVIITGATGMVGRGVLLECLESDKIDLVMLISRRSIGLSHPKIREVLLADFMNVAQEASKLTGYDACFHCMGVTSVGKKEAEYHHLTFNVTRILVDTLYTINPNLVFNYVSGSGTDSTEKGRTMWARVKGKTENYILQKGFSDAYMFRPGAIIPEKGIRSSTSWYNLLYVITRPFYSILKRSKNITTTTRLGQAMINSLYYKQSLKHLENSDINALFRHGV